MSAELIHQMYIAYYQRPADPAGLNYWQAQLSANGGGETGWNAVAAAFANAAESTALYGTQTLGQKIAAIYVASFERAASAEEITFWENSGFNAAQIGFAIVNGAQNDDLATVSKKVDYAEAFVAVVDPAGTGEGPFSFEYTDPSLGRTLMDAVTKDSDVSATTVSGQVSTTLPTLNTINLTSGNDAFSPGANTVDVINAALGGTSPTLSRADQIDGGSATDKLNVDMDGNFLLGFGSGGFMKDVEIINLAATAKSVTPKTFNFTGASGISTVNVGGANAIINLSNLSDVGLTVNLSGQTTGTFEIGYAANAISATGSSMTIGVTDTGASGTVSVLANGIVDLNVVSYGTSNNINLGNGVNDLESVVVTGTGGIKISDMSNTVTAFDASGLSGDLDLVLNVDDMANLVAAGQTITGGTGSNDSIELNGSAIAAFTSTGIEELFFDGASGEVIVRATGMAGLTTLTYSGGNTNTVPNISGLHSDGLTVNTINEGASTQTYVISAGGTLAVNVNADPARVAAETKAANTFNFRSPTTDAVTVNVGPYVSASATYTVQAASSLDISIDSTSTFAGSANASASSSVNVSGAGSLSSATISGEKVTTLNVNVGSGDMAFGGSAIQTVSVTSGNDFTFNTGTNLSGVQTLTVNANSANLTNPSFEALDNATLIGASSMSMTTVDKASGLGNLTMDIDGFAQKASVGTISLASDNIVIDAAGTTGELHVGKASGSGTFTLSGGSLGSFSAGDIDSNGVVTIDLAGRSSTSTGDLVLTSVSAANSLSVALGSTTNGVSASASIVAVISDKDVTVDGASFGGILGVGDISASGNVTISTGTFGQFSANVIETGGGAGSITIDSSNSASTGDLQLTTLSADGGNITLSLGGGSGAVSAGSMVANGAITVDGSLHKGSVAFGSVSASGNIVVSLGGDQGALSAGNIFAAGGSVTLDGSNTTSAQMGVLAISAVGVTVSLGTGSGAISATTIDSGGGVTVDGGNYAGSVDLDNISASGAVVVSLGGNGDFSGSGVHTVNSFTFDASNATSATMTINTISASGNITASLGSGSGSITLTTAGAGGNVIFDGSNSKASIDITMLSSSGTQTFQLGAQGDFSANDVRAGGNVTIDASRSTTADIGLAGFSGQGNLSVVMGTGSGDVVIASANVAGNVVLDAASFDGAVAIESLSVSGTLTVSHGGTGGFSAGSIHSATTSVFDFTNMASAAAVSFTSYSAGALSVTLGGSSGDFVATGISTLDGGSGAFTLTGGTTFSGDIAIGTVSASGAVSVSFANGGGFSAGDINTTKAVTLDNSTGVNGAFRTESISASGVTVNLGSGSGNATLSAVVSSNAFTLTGSGRGDALTLVSASVAGAVNITMGGTGSIAIGAIHGSAAVNISASLGNDGTNEETFSADLISASGLSITLTGGSGAIAASILESSTTFALDISASIEKDTQHDITSVSASAATITMGTGSDLRVSALTVTSAADITMTGSADFINSNFSGGGVLTFTQNGKGDVNFSAITVENGFAYQGTGLGTGATFSAVTISAGGNTGVSFNYGDGAFAFISASTIDTVGGFTIAGASLTTAEIALTSISASAGVTINMGAAGGELQISSVDSLGTFTMNASESSALNFDVNTISASGVSITLGAISAAADATRVSSINTDGLFTLNGGAYRERFDINDISAGTATITFGDMADGFSASIINVESIAFNGGNGANFSATIQDLNISDGSGWNVSMAELGNGLTINDLTFAKSGTIRGTLGTGTEGDSISASVNVTAATEATLNFYLGEDSIADSAHITNVNANASEGALYVRLHDFVAGTDGITTVGSAATVNAINLTTAQMVSTLGEVLNTTISTGDTNLASMANIANTAVFTYNGSSWFLADQGTKGTFGNNDIVFEFVNKTDITDADITQVSG